jgi:hypothetical protein
MIKTFRYALLEIFLVVMGILIAIQLNNWNESRKFKIEQKKFLVGLIDEFNSDLSRINDKIENFSEINEVIKSGRNIISQNLLSEKDKNTFNKTIARFPILTPLNKDVERNNFLISNGIIKSDSLKMMVLEYYELTNYHKEVQTKFGETLQRIYTDQISPLVRFKHSSSDLVDFSLRKLQSSNTFNNAIDLSIGYRNQSILFLETQKKMASELLSFIGQEIK